MRPDPSFALLQMGTTTWRVKLCNLPNEWWTIAAYVAAGTTAGAVALPWTLPRLLVPSRTQRAHKTS